MDMLQWVYESASKANYSDVVGFLFISKSSIGGEGGLPCEVLSASKLSVHTTFAKDGRIL